MSSREAATRTLDASDLALQLGKMNSGSEGRAKAEEGARTAHGAPTDPGSARVRSFAFPQADQAEEARTSVFRRMDTQRTWLRAASQSNALRWFGGCLAGMLAVLWLMGGEPHGAEPSSPQTVAAPSGVEAREQNLEQNEKRESPPVAPSMLREPALAATESAVSSAATEAPSVSRGPAPRGEAGSTRAAVDSLLSGDTPLALDMYRALAIARPGDAGFRWAVRLLERETRDCGRAGGTSCD